MTQPPQKDGLLQKWSRRYDLTNDITKIAVKLLRRERFTGFGQA